MPKSFLPLSAVFIITLGLSCRDSINDLSQDSVPGIAAVGASSITPVSATLRCTVSPHGAPTTCYFEYGTSNTYGDNTPKRDIPSNSTPVAIAETLTTLQPEIVYHWRVVATNVFGVTASADSLFRTTSIDSLPPFARTDSATGVTTSSAILNGTVNPHYLYTSCYFEFGTTQSYGIATQALYFIAGGADIRVSSGVIPDVNTTYHYRIVAENAGGKTLGEDKTFATPGYLPDVREYPVFVLSSSKVQMFGSINGEGSSTTYHIEYGRAANFGQSTSPQDVGTASQRISPILSNLTPGALYHWRIVAANRWGSTYGPDSTFVLPLSVKPFVSPLQVGATWKYRYHLWPNGDIHGLHTWRVVGTDGSGNWTCIDTRLDTLYNGNPWRNDSISFVIRDFPDYIQLEFPEWLGLFDQSRRVPKLVDATKDTITFEGSIVYGVEGRERSVYVNGVGLVDYYGKEPSMVGTIDGLSLIEYSPP
jgi:hypothetical protein